MTVRRTQLGLLALVALTLAPRASADILVWLDPAVSEVAVGQAVTLDLLASFEEPVIGWGLDLTIEPPACAAWTGTVIGNNWDPPQMTLDGDGLAGLRFPDGLSGEILLATLTFEGLTEGTATLTLSMGPEEDEGFLLAAGGLATNVAFTPATMTVVPEPAAWGLLATLGIVTLRRPRRS